MSSAPNDHIRVYLEQFLRRDPKFALMITGSWGIGKTYLIKKLLRTHPNHLYVSLNGTAKVSDIVERLYIAAFPILSDKAMRALGGLAKTIAGAFRIKSNLKAEDILDIDNYNTIVFDDVERSSILPSELFGFINNFVEHDEKHVILIANENELHDRQGYSNIKEKVIGFTLQLNPDFKSLLDDIYNSVDKPYADFLRSLESDLIELITSIKLKNMRVTRYVISDFYEIFLQSHGIVSNSSMRDLYLTFFAINCSYRMGEIDRNDIATRQVDTFARIFAKSADETKKSKIDLIQERYSSVDLFSSIYDNEFLESKICDGFHDKDKLHRTLGDIAGMSEPKSNPEWRNLWYLLQQDDDVILESFERVMNKFHSRSYDDSGVILHVFGLLYRVRSLGLLRWSKSRILRESKKFIRDKFLDRSLPILDSDYLRGFRHGAAHGLGFSALEEPGFQEATNFYREKSSELKDINILDELDKILTDEDFDIPAFRAIILQGEREDNIFSRPLLQKISPRAFADSIIRQSAEKQYSIINSLGSRYKDTPYQEVRSVETPWFSSVRRYLLSGEYSRSYLTKYRLKEIISWNIPDTDASE